GQVGPLACCCLGGSFHSPFLAFACVSFASLGCGPPLAVASFLAFCSFFLSAWLASADLGSTAAFACCALSGLGLSPSGVLAPSDESCWDGFAPSFLACGFLAVSLGCSAAEPARSSCFFQVGHKSSLSCWLMRLASVGLEFSGLGVPPAESDESDDD